MAEQKRIFMILHARKMRMQSLSISEERIYNNYLERLSGDFEHVSEDSIILICCFLLEEDIDDIRKTSQYFKVVLNRDEFYYAYARTVYEVDLQEIKNEHLSRFSSFRNVKKKVKIPSLRFYLKRYERESLNHILSDLRKKYSKANEDTWENLNPDIPKIMLRRRDFAIEAVSSLNGLYLYFLNHQFQKDEFVVTQAVKKTPKSMLYAHSSLRNNKEFILKILRGLSSPNFLEFCNDEIRNDMEIGVTVLCVHGKIRNYSIDFENIIGTELWNSSEFFSIVCLFNPSAYDYIVPNELKKSKKVLLSVLRYRKILFNDLEEHLKNDADIYRVYSRPKRMIKECSPMMIKKVTKRELFEPKTKKKKE